jgi:glycosyltransferase involved in cell wall biosynthesis
MNVLWVTNMWPDAERPWYGSFVHSQARSLERIGVDLDVLYVPGYRSSREYARGAEEVLRRSKRRRYDLVHAHYGHSGVLARLQTKAPVLLSYCGDDLLGTPKPGGAGITRRSVVLARGFAQLSRALQATITKSEEMELRLPVGSRKRNNVIPNGVDLAAFEPVPKAQARARLAWSGAVKNLLFVGNPEFPRKNVKLAESVRDELLRRGTKVELRIAWQVDPDAMSLWFAASDVLLFTSLFEGSPNTVKEAMAMELPIVSAPVGDVPERLRDVEGALVVQRDPNLMADAVETALQYERIPAARAALAELSIEKVAERIESLYRSLSRA